MGRAPARAEGVFFIPSMTTCPDEISPAAEGGIAPAYDARTQDTLQAVGESYDVVVAGAGIAGATAARLFAERGLKVLLAEREAFPRYKVCGSCLNLRALAFLKSAGMDAALEEGGAAPLHGLTLSAGGRLARVPLPGGLAASRALVDSCLVQAACERGAHFVDTTSVVLGPARGAAREVVLRQSGAQRTIAARLVLAAGGLQGALIDRSGEGEVVVSCGARIGVGVIHPEAPARFEPGQIYMACGPQGYAGLVRAEEGQLVIAAALHQPYIRHAGGPGPAVEQLLHASALPAPPPLSGLQWKGTPPLTRRATRLSASRVLVLGDAGGYVEPFTGEGMAWAFDSAHAADALMAGNLDQAWEPLSAAWERSRRRAMARQRLLCIAMARVLRSPRATSALVAALSRSSMVSRPFVRLLNATGRS